MMHRGVGMWGEIISRDELLNLDVKIGYINGMEWHCLFRCRYKQGI
jgi:hypothetical protein